MRETFERNMQAIDQAVANSLDELKRNPHDEVSEQMLNESLNDKLALLKEFSDFAELVLIKSPTVMKTEFLTRRSPARARFLAVGALRTRRRCLSMLRRSNSFPGVTPQGKMSVSS